MKRGRGKCVGREDRVKGLGGGIIFCVSMMVRKHSNILETKSTEMRILI